MEIIFAIIGEIISCIIWDELFDAGIEIIKVITGPLIGGLGLIFIIAAYYRYKQRNMWIYRWGICDFSYNEVFKVLAIGIVFLGICILGLGGVIIDIIITIIAILIIIFIFSIIWTALCNESIVKRILISTGLTVFLIAISPVLMFIPFLNIEGSMISNVGKTVSRLERKVISDAGKIFSKGEKKALVKTEETLTKDIGKSAEKVEDKIINRGGSKGELKGEGKKTGSNDIKSPPKNGLSKEAKSSMIASTGWSSKIVNSIGSELEYKIYQGAKLREQIVNSKECLVKKINWNKVDQFGRTNRERGKIGLAPLDDNGTPLELHHIGQKDDSPLAELSIKEHRGKGNDIILHDKTKETEIDRIKFANERIKHWETRAMEGK